MNGKINFFDYCNVDLIYLLEFEDMVKVLGYTGKFDYYCDAEDGNLKKLENDIELMNFLGTSL